MKIGAVQITAFDGKPVTSAEQLIATVDAERPRAKVTLTVRRGSRPLTLVVTLGTRPQSGPTG